MSDKGPQFMPSAVQNTEFNEGNYRELIDKSLLGLAIIQDRRLIYANVRLAEIIGHSLEDMLVLSADNFMSIIHPDDRTGILGALIDGISSNKLPLRREFRIIRKNGDVVWTDALANFIEINGKPAMQVAFMDITSRKNTECKSNEAREEYLEILNSISDGFLSLDQDLKITYLNKAAELLLGRPEFEAIGCCIFDAFPEAEGSFFRDSINKAVNEKRFISLEARFETISNENWLDMRLYPKENGLSIHFQMITERKEKEEMLRKSVEQYHQLFNNMLQGVVCQEADGTIISANPAARRMLGLITDQMNRRTTIDPRFRTIHVDGSDFSGEEYPSMAALAAGKTIENVVMGIFNPHDGELRWITANAFPQFLPGETKPYRVFTTLEDITERKKSEDLLGITIQRFNSLISSMFASLLLVADDGRIEYANQAFCDFFNLDESPEELTVLTASQMIERIKNAYFYPDKEVDRIKEIVLQGKPVKGEEIAMRDGRTCLRDFIPINIDGKSYGRLWHHHDITERKQIEEALKRSEQKFRGFVESSEEGISLIDSYGNIIEWNSSQEHITGLKREAVFGQPAWDVMHQLMPQEHQTPKAHEKLKTFLIRLSDKGRKPLRSWIGEKEIQSANGTRKTVQEVFFPIKTENGYNIGVITHDITERIEMERSLKIKDEAVDSALNAMSLADPSGNLFFANESWLRMLGYEREEIGGRPILDFIENYKDADEITKEINLTGRWEGETVLRKKDGSMMEIYLTSSTVKDKSNRFICTINSFIDISKIKKAQRELTESKNKLKAIFDLVPAGIFVVNNDGRIIEANQSFLNFMGLTIEELVQNKHRDRRFFSADGTFLTSEDVLHEHPATSKPVPEKYPYKYIEFGMEKENGDVVWANATAASTLFEDWSLVIALLDVTERRKIEEELRIKDAVIEDAITAIAIADLEGNLTYINKELSNLWGYKKEEVLGKQASAFWENSSMFEVIKDALFKTGSWSGDLVGKKKDGTTFDFHIVTSLIKDAAGNALCLYGSNLDITERKKLERELKEREERFRKIFELSPAGILLFDSEGFLTHANQASRKILEVIDVKHKRYNLFRDLLGDIEKHHKLLSGQTVREGRWINAKPGKAAKLDKLDKDMFRNRMGQIYIENQVAVLGEADQPVGYLCIQQDLTEKKLTDEIMISENERLQIIYDLWKNRVKISDMKLKDY